MRDVSAALKVSFAAGVEADGQTIDSMKLVLLLGDSSDEGSLVA